MIPDRVLRFKPGQAKLHAKLLELRHQVYAHADSSRHPIQPLGIKGFPSAIEHPPELQLGCKQLERSVKLIDRLTVSLRTELRILIRLLDPEDEK